MPFPFFFVPNSLVDERLILEKRNSWFGWFVICLWDCWFRGGIRSVALLHLFVDCLFTDPPQIDKDLCEMYHHVNGGPLTEVTKAIFKLHVRASLTTNQHLELFSTQSRRPPTQPKETSRRNSISQKRKRRTFKKIEAI